MLHHASVKAIRAGVAMIGEIIIASVAIRPLRQALAGLMQKARRIFGGVHHLEFANIERILLRQISAPALLQAGRYGQPIRFADALAQQQAPQHWLEDPPQTSGSISTRNFGCVPLCGE